MEKLIEPTDFNDQIILETNSEIEQEKEKKLVNLIVQIIVTATLKEYYEKSD